MIAALVQLDDAVLRTGADAVLRRLATPTSGAQSQRPRSHLCSLLQAASEGRWAGCSRARTLVLIMTGAAMDSELGAWLFTGVPPALADVLLRELRAALLSVLVPVVDRDDDANVLDVVEDGLVFAAAAAVTYDEFARLADVRRRK